MELKLELSLEQRFELYKLRVNAEKVSHEQLIDLFVEVNRQLMIKSNVLKELMRRSL